MSQEPNSNCSERLVQMNFFILSVFFSGGFSSSEFCNASTSSPLSVNFGVHLKLINKEHIKEVGGR